LEKNKIGSAGAEAIAHALKSNTTLTELVLLGQNKEFGEQCLSAWIDCFEYNVHLLKITWRLNSRQSFKINKSIVRNNEIQKRLKNGTNYDELLPKNVVGLSRSEPVPEHVEPKSGSDQSTTKEPVKNEHQEEHNHQEEQHNHQEEQHNHEDHHHEEHNHEEHNHEHNHEDHHHEEHNHEEHHHEEPVNEDEQEIGEDN